MKCKVCLSPILLGLFCIFPSFLSAQQSNKPKVFVGAFLPFQTRAKRESLLRIEKNIQLSLKRSLEAKGFFVRILRGKDLRGNLEASKKGGADFLLQGYYKKNHTGSLNLYGQIYNGQTGRLIDASNTIDEIAEIQGIQIPPEELTTQEESIRKFTRKIILRIRANPKRKAKWENIKENLINSPIAGIYPLPLHRQSDKAVSEDVFKVLGDVKVVSASRRAQKISEAPSNIVVITADMIERRGYLTLTDALQDLPFFDFATFQPAGEYPTHFALRGMSDVGQTKVLIMEDGIVQNDISNGWARNLGYNITLVDVDRIEIIFGPGSALYGSNAYAGIVNIITKKGTEIFKNKKHSGLYVDASGLYSYTKTHPATGPLRETQYAGFVREEKINETYAGEAFLAYKYESGLILQFAARRFKSEGDGGLNRPDPGNYFHNNYEPESVSTTEYGKVENDRLADGRTKRIPDGFDTSIDDIFLRGKLIKDYFTFGFNYWERREGLGSEVPGYEYFANKEGVPYLAQHAGYTLFASYDVPLTKRLESKTRLYYRNTMILPDTGFVYTYKYQSVDRPVKDGVLYPPVVDKVKGYHGQGFLTGFEEQLNYSFTNTNELVTGLQVERLQRQNNGISLGKKQATDSTVVEKTYTSEEKSKQEVFYSTNLAAYLQDEQKFWENNAFTVGIRYDIFSDVEAEDRIYYKGKKQAAGILNPRAGIVGNPWRGLNYKLLYGEAFKKPTLFELNDEFRGNPKLQPQKIKTYEVELIYNFKKHLSLNGGYYMNQLTNVIEVKANDGSFPIGPNGEHETFYQNVTATHIYGYWTGLRFNWGKKLSMYANYNYTADRDPKTPFLIQADQQTGEIQAIEPLEDGHEIDGIAMHKGNIGLNYIFMKKLNINIRMNIVGKRKAPKTNKYFNPDFCDFFYTLCGKSAPAYIYEFEGKPDGYMSGYRLVHLTLTWKDSFGSNSLMAQLIIRNLFNVQYLGMGRQAGSSTRPRGDLQPTIQNPDGFIPPYHPQPGREIFFKLTYRYF